MAWFIRACWRNPARRLDSIDATPCLQNEAEARRGGGISKAPRRHLAGTGGGTERGGISDYSIFFDEETLTLFAVQKLSDGNTAAALPKSPVLRKWWDYMAPLMEVQPDHAPVEKPLAEVFHLD